MNDYEDSRRRFLIGAAGALGAPPALLQSTQVALASATGRSAIEYEKAAPKSMKRPRGAAIPVIRFAVCGMSHDHIHEMVDTVEGGGGILAAAYGAEPDKVARFRTRHPHVPIMQSARAILEDTSIQLVLGAGIASERAATGIAALKHGKDFLSDKPGATTLEDIEEIRRTVVQTRRTYGIFYSERFTVKAVVAAGQVVQSGRIGRVVQTLNIAPHQVAQPGAVERPAWFWNPAQSGGILCDIGAHQADQFVYFTGSTSAQVLASQVANVAHGTHAGFQDFGDMLLQGDCGTGYARVDWLTPAGLGTWGDGRLFILGTQGFIEIRKYADLGRSLQENTLLVADQERTQVIDCSAVELPFGAQIVADVVDRTHTAQDQSQCLLAAELAVRAQLKATTVQLRGGSSTAV